jgi:hypothetical protein
MYIFLGFSVTFSKNWAKFYLVFWSHWLVTPGAYPRRKHLKVIPIGLALTLPSNSKICLERVSKDKPSCLLVLVISDEGKKVSNIDIWSQ